jgi:ABC-type nitrate/sulfonate/bicarbonate transport system substrate-binding protein
MHRMAHGPYEIATTAMDNVVGLTEGQGEAPIPGFDLVAFAGVHRGTAYIVSRPEITSYAQIRGRTVCVDAIGYAYGMVLYKALENHGLLPDRDYHVAAVGTSDKRLATMQHHKAVACLLSPPEDSEATALGYHVLGDTSSALGSIQVSIYAGHRAWLQSHRGVVVAFIRSVIAANDYIFANRAGSLAILRKHVRGLNASRAQAIYAGLTSPKVGLNRHAALDLQGVRNVLAVRSEFGRPKMSITDPNKYIDTSFYASASRATPLR